MKRKCAIYNRVSVDAQIQFLSESREKLVDYSKNEIFIKNVI